jgi:hypothetical protein
MSQTNPAKHVGEALAVLKSIREQDEDGRFAMYVPPVMEALDLAEVEHNPKNNRMRAK